jgi:hypothetical protein
MNRWTTSRLVIPGLRCRTAVFHPGPGHRSADSHPDQQALGQLEEACGQVLDGSFKPASLDKLVRRGDEIGYMAREFTSMARQVESRNETLTAEAQSIQGKIK